MRESEKIGVLNYNQNVVSVTTPTRDYVFEPSEDGVTPFVIPLTMEEIRYVNNSAAFRNGLLFFDKSKEKEVYEELSINNWEDILTNQDIADIIIHPTYEGLKRIINIKDVSTFERVRGAYYKLKTEGTYDISERVVQIINTRHKELSRGKIRTAIELTTKDVPVQVNTEEVDALKAQNAAMQEQMAQMQQMLEQMMKQQQTSQIEPKPTDNSTTTKTTKKPGRPKKTS